MHNRIVKKYRKDIHISKEVYPDYYGKTWDFIEEQNFNFNLGEVIAHIVKSQKKDNELENLMKAKRYLEREISRVRNA